jgi:hypothetical protein
MKMIMGSKEREYKRRNRVWANGKKEQKEILVG